MFQLTMENLGIMKAQMSKLTIGGFCFNFWVKIIKANKDLSQGH